MNSRKLVTFVLDTNIFIAAFRSYYKPSLCPGFWQALAYYHSCGRILSIDKVLNELAAIGDEIYEWALGMPSDFFAATNKPSVWVESDKMMAKVRARKQYTDQVSDAFAAKADRWLVAYAMATGSTVVTEEARNYEAKGRVLIPNVCDDVGVNCINTFSMLNDLCIVFNWQEPKRIAQP